MWMSPSLLFCAALYCIENFFVNFLKLSCFFDKHFYICGQVVRDRFVGSDLFEN